MKFKAFLAVSALALAMIAPSAVVFAQEVVTTPTESITLSPEEEVTQSMVTELAQLKLKEKDPTTGSFTRFLLRFKIRQLENQLNIKKALQENPA